MAELPRPFLSMCLIAKNERHNIERCFDSWFEAVDQIVLCDTGSTDGTVEKARQYCTRRRGLSKLRVVEAPWTDDFAAARNAADAAATGEWVTWADLDDSVEGLDRLREQAQNASADVVAFFAHYSYALDPDGNCISELWRERVVRNGAAEWTGRLHEHKLFTAGSIVQVDPKTARWVHHRKHEQSGPNERNLRILEKWDRDDPGNPRVLSSLGLEYVAAERHRDASDVFARYLACDGEPADRRCQATRYMCVMLLQQGRIDEAKAAAHRALAEDGLWADSYLTLAEVAQTQGRPQEAYRHALTALQLGKPQTLLIVNPLQYTAQPRTIMAVCLAQLGRFDDALKLADEVTQIAPSYPLIVQNAPLWRGHLKREQTVSAFQSCAQLLVGDGELEKARQLFDCLPHYVTDDPRVIDGRADAERRLKAARERKLEPLGDDAAGKFVLRHLERVAA